MTEDNYALKKWAVYNQEPTARKVKEWTGYYKGIFFEINNYSLSTKDFENCWAHYIYINLDHQLSKEKADSLWLNPRYEKASDGSDHPRYDYYASPVSEIEFHGGCTYYSKGTRVDEKNRTVKIGCDYQHFSDMGSNYTLDYVYKQVKRTIDSFIEIFGPVKVRSCGDGVYRLIEEFE